MSAKTRLAVGSILILAGTSWASAGTSTIWRPAALPVFSVLLGAALVWAAYTYRNYRRRLEEQREESRQAAALHLRTIETLALAIEAKDQLSAGEARRVSIYAVEIAKEIGLRELEVEALRAASLLYDVGEMAVPEHIMLKSGPLTPEEFDKVKIHPVVGSELLNRVSFPYPVAGIVHSHHERWDGTGYPQGLRGNQIPMGARILSVVDALHALMSPRPYRPALTFQEAIEEIVADSGRAFDPRVVKVLRKRHAQWEKLAAEQLRDGFVDSIFAAQREGQVVFDLVQKLGTSLDLNETIAALKPALRALTRFETLILWVERDGFLYPECVEGAHLAWCSSVKIPSGGGVSGWVAANGKPIVNGDASFELASGRDPNTCPFNYVLAVPLEQNGVRGALSVYRIGERQFSSEDARRLSAVTPQLSTALANSLKFRETSEQASTDGLTGLANAGALFNRLASHPPGALLVCDLDGFKQVNDRFGHVAGNRLLQGIAEGFQKACRGNDFVARMGGDEFVVLIDHISPAEIGHRIQQFREMVRSTGRQICGEDAVDASFGAAFHPADGNTAEDLLAFADQQMYRQKAEQKAGVARIDVQKLSA
jgi:diguanylate cyclase (GGDEF)-like protein